MTENDGITTALYTIADAIRENTSAIKEAAEPLDKLASTVNADRPPRISIRSETDIKDFTGNSHTAAFELNDSAAAIVDRLDSAREIAANPKPVKLPHTVTIMQNLGAIAENTQAIAAAIKAGEDDAAANE